MANRFKKGDEVIIISGSDKGKVSNIILCKNDKVLVKGVNIKTIHKKPTSNSPGKIDKIERFIHISNISHVEDGKAVKVCFKVSDGKGKIFLRKNRISRRTGKKI